MEIINKKNERVDWQNKLASMSVNEAKQWQVNEYRRCTEDKEYWFSQYVWTIDPRKTPSIVPFILYSHQIRLIKQLDMFGDTFIDKSRQMGISWTIMGWELHNALYIKGFTALNISRKESEVQDSGNTYHSLHGRLFFMYQRLAPFLRPRIYNPYLTFQVPVMNSIIKGESSNPKAGRDSQYKFIFIDEAAHIECLDEMWKGCRNATNSICLNSTPPKSQVNNKFAEIKKIEHSGFTHMSFHWSEHPEYNEEWYKKKTAAMTPQEIAQELEIAYDSSLTNLSYPEFDNAIHIESRKIHYNPKYPLYCFMDFGLGGEVFLFAQKDFKDRLFFIYYRIYKDMLTPELYQEMIKCLAHIGYAKEIKDITFVGDKSGNKRSRTSKTSVIDEYRRISNGAIDIKSREITIDEKMRDMKACLKRKIDSFPQFNISNEKTCLQFAECMKLIELNTAKMDHVDNRYTHAVNAAEYGISWLFPRKKTIGVMVSLDPGQKIERKNGDIEIFDNNKTKGASVEAIVGTYRIERKGVMIS